MSGEMCVEHSRLLESKVTDSTWKKQLKELKKCLPNKLTLVSGGDATLG